MFDDLLLLKKGGEVVYHGPLGENSCELINYFESKGATPIELGDNPANWILRIMQDHKLGDLAEVYLNSEERGVLENELALLTENPEPAGKMEVDEPFAVGRATRQLLVTHRLRTIYWRSTTYNLGRITISLVMACLLGAVFITERKDLTYSEADIRARIAVIFFSNIIVGIMSIVSVLPVMTWIRDMFYRHDDAGMYDSMSLGFALGTAEQWFIAVSRTKATVTAHLAESSQKLLIVHIEFRGSFLSGIFERRWFCLGSNQGFRFLRILYIQLGPFLVLWSILCVHRQKHESSYDIGWCLHWFQQFVCWAHHSAANYGRNPVRCDILHHARSLRFRRRDHIHYG